MKKQTVQLLFSRKAKMTVKDRGNVRSEFSPNYYVCVAKSKIIQVAGGSMHIFTPPAH